MSIVSDAQDETALKVQELAREQRPVRPWRTTSMIMVSYLLEICFLAVF